MLLSDSAAPQNLAPNPGRRRLQQADGLDQVALPNSVWTNQYIHRPEFHDAVIERQDFL